ncbi:MAG: hypothetical protein JRM78_02625, partial [Nitrososphaerota archaeon]|nr:hypothetical protein [Nitrososphaerota archaeon]
MNRVEVVLGVILLILAVTPSMGLMIASSGGSTTINAYFLENGLPAGLTWSVTSGGASYSSGSGYSIAVPSPTSSVEINFTIPDVVYVSDQGEVVYYPNFPSGTLSAS